VAGVSSTLACHPFDVLRVKMQSAALATASGAARYVGPVQTFRHMVQYGGFHSLYAGLTLPLAAQAIYKGTVFMINNVTSHALQEWKTQENYKLGIFSPYHLTLTDRFICGFLGGAVNAALFVTPVEYVRNQLIEQQSLSQAAARLGATSKTAISAVSSSGPISVIRRTIQTHGAVGLWRGLASTVLRDSVGCGCFFVAMAYSQEKLMTVAAGENNKARCASGTIVSGALAGVAFWLWALPVDTMKTWIQNGTARDLRHAWELSQERGFAKSIPSLLRGWQVAYGRGAPSAAITVTVYSLAYRWMEVEEEW
jgi:ornithine carrier protein